MIRLLLTCALSVLIVLPALAQRKTVAPKKPSSVEPTTTQLVANTVVADVSLPRLPPRYIGDNAGTLIQRLGQLGLRIQKNEFETTAAYETRVSDLLRSIKFGGGRTAADRLTFVHPYGKMSYDADAQTAAFTFDTRTYTPGVNYTSIDLTRIDRSLGSRTGRTAIGIRKRISVWAYTAVRLAVPKDLGTLNSMPFHIPPKEAQEASGKLWLAISGHLERPFFGRENDVDNATLDDPEEAHYFNFYLYFAPDSVILFNALTGQIYTTRRFDNGIQVDRSSTSQSLAGDSTRKKTVGKTLSGGRCVVQLLDRPEPQYTEQARAAQVSGTVALSILLGNKSGEVSEVKVIRDLPDGLTDRAIQAAKQIKFVPAELDGKTTPCRINIEYNFSVW